MGRLFPVPTILRPPAQDLPPAGQPSIIAKPLMVAILHNVVGDRAVPHAVDRGVVVCEGVKVEIQQGVRPATLAF